VGEMGYPIDTDSILAWCSPLKQCVEGDRVSSGSSFQLMGLPSFSLSIAIPEVQPQAKGEVAQTKGASFCSRFFGTSIRTMPFTIFYLLPRFFSAHESS
jgi:hypothetical protein